HHLPVFVRVVQGVTSRVTPLDGSSPAKDSRFGPPNQQCCLAIGVPILIKNRGLGGLIGLPNYSREKKCPVSGRKNVNFFRWNELVGQQLRRSQPAPRPGRS